MQLAKKVQKDQAKHAQTREVCDFFELRQYKLSLQSVRTSPAEDRISHNSLGVAGLRLEGFEKAWT